MAVLLYWTAPAVSQEGARASYSDIESFYQQHAWVELAEHLKDIRPLERDDRWRAMTEVAAIGYLEQLESEQAYAQALSAAEQLLATYPMLADVKRFAVKQADIAVKQLAVCLRESQEADRCLAPIKTRLEQDSDNAHLAFGAAEALVNAGKPTDAALFYQTALSVKSSPYSCGGKLAARAVISGLKEYPGLATAAAGRELAGGPCWQEMRERLAAELAKQPTENFRRNLCAVLAAKNALIPPADRLCVGFE